MGNGPFWENSERRRRNRNRRYISTSSPGETVRMGPPAPSRRGSGSRTNSNTGGVRLSPDSVTSRPIDRPSDPKYSTTTRGPVVISSDSRTSMPARLPGGPRGTAANPRGGQGARGAAGARRGRGGQPGRTANEKSDGKGRKPDTRMTLPELIIAVTQAARQAAGAPQQIAPALVDVQSAIQPYIDAERLARQTALVREADIGKLTDQNVERARDYGNVDQAQIEALRRLQARQAAETAELPDADNQAALAGLEAQGVQSSIVQELRAAQEMDAAEQARRAQEFSANTDEAGRLAALDEKERVRTAEQAEGTATDDLKSTLASTVLQLAQEKAATESNVNLSNAQARNDAVMANAQLQAQHEDLIRQAVADARATIEQNPEGVFGTPNRNKIREWINNYDERSNIDIADDVLNQVFNTAKDADQAKALLPKVMKVWSDKYKQKHKDSTPAQEDRDVAFNDQMLYDFIDRWYATGTKVKPNVADQFIQAALSGLL